MKRSVFPKFLSVALMVVMVMAVTFMPVYAASVSDISNHWAKDVISAWVEKGLIKGYEDGTFKPNSSIKRAELVKMVNNIMGYTATSDISYDDVKTSDWFFKDVQIAKTAGYITGYSDKSFGPNDFVTREQAAAILIRINKLEQNEDAAKLFVDSADISQWAKGAVGAAAEVLYIKGYEDNTFKPTKNLTRAEAVFMIDSIINTKNAIINKDGQILKDKDIEGNVIVAKSLGEGTAYIKNVKVKGSIIVNGGGSNSLHLDGVNASKIQVNKLTPTRVSAEGESKIGDVNIEGNCKLETTGNATVETLVINSSEPVVITGNVKNLIIESNAKVSFVGAKIENLIINSNATVEMDKKSKVVVAEVNGAATLSGEGKIITVKVNSNDVKITEGMTDKSKIIVSPDVKVPPVIEKPEVTPTPGGGGDGGGSVTPPPAKQKVLKITSSRGQIANISYNNSDTLQSAFKTFVNDSGNKGNIEKAILRLNNVKINGKAAWSQENFDKFAGICNITTGSAIYADLKPADFTKVTVADIQKISNAIDALIKHIEDNNAVIKTNIANSNLANAVITKDGKPVSFKVTFGTETKTSLKDIADYLLTNRAMFTGTIDNISIRVIFEITAPSPITVTIEKSTL